MSSRRRPLEAAARLRFKEGYAGCMLIIRIGRCLVLSDCGLIQSQSLFISPKLHGNFKFHKTLPRTALILVTIADTGELSSSIADIIGVFNKFYAP